LIPGGLSLRLKTLITAGVDVNERYTPGRALLIFAAQGSRNLQIVMTVLPNAGFGGKLKLINGKTVFD